MDNKNTFMRANKELLETLKKLKLCKGESYQQVVKRLIKKDRGQK